LDNNKCSDGQGDNESALILIPSPPASGGEALVLPIKEAPSAIVKGRAEVLISRVIVVVGRKVCE
jgi:hypothetical protein